MSLDPDEMHDWRNTMLNMDLADWESKAFERRRRQALLAIEVEGDHATISGPACVVRNVMDTSLLDYIEVDGMIRARLYDPIPHRSRQIANAALSVVSRIWRRK